MPTLEELETRLGEVAAIAAQALEIAAQHGPEHATEAVDSMTGRYQEKTTSGAPTHEAPAGTRCHVTPDLADYINKAGGTTWTLLETGGAGAPMGAQYLVLAEDGDLTAERRLVAGDGLSGADSAPPNGTYTLSVDDPHVEVHTVVSHDTLATGTQLNTLVAGATSDASALHDHPGGLTTAAHTAIGDGTPHHSELHGHTGFLTTASHAAVADGTPHHVKYTDAEARAAVPYVVVFSFGYDPQTPQAFTPP